MKVIALFAFVVICHTTVRGKPLAPGNTTNICTRKQVMKNLCDTIKRDMGTLFNMADKKRHRGNTKTHPRSRSMLLTFSTVKKLGKDKIVERLYFFHNILGDAYGSFGSARRYQKIKVKTINVVIQIQALADILKNNTKCNPGQPGNEFAFNLPTDNPLSGNIPGFLYHFVALLREMLPEFEKNVVKELKLI